MTTTTAQPHRVYGPSALGASPHRFWELTLTLARSEFKLRYFGSVLGYAWSLMRPILFFGVLYVVFTRLFDLGRGVPNYGVYLLTGIILWNYILESTAQCVQCLVVREGLLRKIRFPRLVVPLSVSLTAVFNLTMNMIAVLIFTLVSGISPALSWLEMIPILGGFIVMGTGLGMLLCALYVRFRDIQPIWEVLQQMLFYACPIMYLASAYKGLEHIAMLNPFAVLLTQMGAALIHPACVPTYCPMRSASAAAGGPLHLAIALVLMFGTLAVGFAVFTHEAPRISENL